MSIINCYLPCTRSRGSERQKSKVEEEGCVFKNLNSTKGRTGSDRSVSLIFLVVILNIHKKKKIKSQDIYAGNAINEVKYL